MENASESEVGVLLLRVSYARADDEPFVHRLHADLMAAGITVWFDREVLLSRGLRFHQKIKDAIRCEVDRVVYVGGPKAALSAYVREEWQLGLEFDHIVVTPILRLGDYLDIPGELEPVTLRGLSRRCHIRRRAASRGRVEKGKTSPRSRHRTLIAGKALLSNLESGATGGRYEVS